MPTASINGVELYYETFGAGYPLLFIHGGFGGLGTGTGQRTPAWVETLAQQFRVILYDRRSSGRSAFPESKHTMQLLADDAYELLRHLGIERAHVWGTSAGGFIAVALALFHPEVVAGLVVAESATRLSQDETLLAGLRDRVALLERDGAVAAYEARRTSGTVGLNIFAAERPALTDEETREREQRRAELQAQLAQVPREERIAKYAGELRNYSAYTDWDATPRLGELTMPTLLVFGTADTVFPQANWEALIAGRPNFTYVPIEGADHGQAATSERGLAATIEFLRAQTPVTA